MNLKRPMVVLDLETTGVSVYTDRIVEFHAIKILPDGGRSEFGGRVNPGIPISPEATAVHGIEDYHVADLKPFRDFSAQFLAFLQDCDFAGYNIRRFDLPMLEEEFKRCGAVFSWRDRAVVDAYLLWTQKEPRDLSGAVQRFLGRSHEDAHGAAADASATLRIIEVMVRNPGWEVPDDPAAISEICDPPDPDRFDPDGKLRWAGNDLALAFGKYKGKTLRELATFDRGMLLWILGKDFSPEVKGAVKMALDGRFVARTQP